MDCITGFEFFLNNTVD